MSATIIPFPCKRRIGKARHAAWKYLDAIDHRPGCASPYYRQVEGHLRSSMEKAGIAPADINRELQDFQKLFVDELIRQSRVLTIMDRGDCA